MQVRVLRHAQPGSSAYGAIGPENSTPAPAEATLADPAIIIEPTHIQSLTPNPRGLIILRAHATQGAPAWLPGPRAQFLAQIQQLEAAAPQAQLCLWPTPLAAISDIPSLRSFLIAAQDRARPWLFLFDPVSMLTPAMLPKAEDHFTRLFESLANHPARWATLLSDATTREDELVPAPLGTSPLTPLLLRAWRDANRPGPVVLLDADLPAQKALLAP
jgi:hypothetical protein